MKQYRTTTTIELGRGDTYPTGTVFTEVNPSDLDLDKQRSLEFAQQVSAVAGVEAVFLTDPKDPASFIGVGSWELEEVAA